MLECSPTNYLFFLSNLFEVRGYPDNSLTRTSSEIQTTYSLLLELVFPFTKKWQNGRYGRLEAIAAKSAWIGTQSSISNRKLSTLTKVLMSGRRMKKK